ncbi:response regulator, partial [bacterium]|nr:response regulator [bacterium]
GKAYRAVLLDMTMPRMGGLESFETIRRIVPGVPVLFISGYGKGNLKEALRKFPHISYLPKPFKVEQLLAALDELLP